MAERTNDIDFGKLASDQNYVGMIAGGRVFDTVGVPMPGSVYRHVTPKQLRIAYYGADWLEDRTSAEITERYVFRVKGHVELCTNGCRSTAEKILMDGNPYRKGETK